jgi:ATP adenylyltransferase
MVYLTSERPEGCLFCILPQEDDDEKNLILYRGQHSFVIINRYPYTNGHVMVVANRHVDLISELSVDESTEVMALVSRCERALTDVYNPGGINVGANLGASAGAGIPGHPHVHLVPRWHGDTSFMTSVGGTRVISEDLDETFKRFKPYFED